VVVRMLLFLEYRTRTLRICALACASSMAVVIGAVCVLCMNYNSTPLISVHPIMVDDIPLFEGTSRPLDLVCSSSVTYRYSTAYLISEEQTRSTGLGVASKRGMSSNVT
jgi:hypothetical protein